MSPLADLPELVGFFSYSRDDDEAFHGSLSALRDAISRELGARLARNKSDFRLFQDREAIAPGKLWEVEIAEAIKQSAFFIPIVTPRSVGSPHCKFEFASFRDREKDLGRNDLIFPILYLEVPQLNDDAKWRMDPVLSVIGQRQYFDWQPFRHLSINSTATGEAIEYFCKKIAIALREPWTSPDEIRALSEEARLKAIADEESRRQEEAEKDAQAKADKIAEEEKRREVAETLATIEEEAHQRKVAEKAKKDQAERDAEDARRRAVAEKLAAQEEMALQRKKEAEIAEKEKADRIAKDKQRREASEALAAYETAVLQRKEAERAAQAEAKLIAELERRKIRCRKFLESLTWWCNRNTAIIAVLVLCIVADLRNIGSTPEDISNSGGQLPSFDNIIGSQTLKEPNRSISSPLDPDVQKETVAQQPEQTSSAELAIATSQAQDRQTAQHIAEKAAPAEQDAIRQEPAKEKTTEVGLNGNASDQKAAALPNGAQFLSLSTRFESNPKNQKGGSNRYEKGGPKSSELRIPTMFDCSKVSFGSDYVVCASPELLDAEARLEDAYNSARLADKEDRVKSDQRDWIRQLQSNCGLPYRGNPGAALIRGSSRCVKQAIEQRIFQLVVLQF